MAKERGLRRAGGKRLSEAGSSRLLEQIQAELLEHLDEQSAAATIPVAPPTAPSGWLAAALGSWLLVAALLVLQPAIVRPPVSRPFKTAVGKRDASLRYGVWLAHHRVQEFVATNQRLPSFLGEAGVNDSSVTMRVTGERSYVLEASEGSSGVRFTSEESPAAFLGESLHILLDS